MGEVQNLAKNTAWYGLSSMGSRMLNYLLTPFLTRVMLMADYGDYSLIYAIIPFFNVIFTYGMETAYFRYTSIDGKDSKTVFSTASLSLLISTIFLTSGIMVLRVPIANILSIQDHPEFVTWFAWVIALDTLTALPFAKLRYEERPVRYASVRIISVVVNVVCIIFFYGVLPRIAHPGSFWASIYDPHLGAGYIIIANIIQNVVQFILLLPQFLSVRFQIDKVLWKEMFIYSLPLVVAGFGGMINEVMDRIMLEWWAPVSSLAGRKQQVAIYSGCYKLSLLVTIFIQAFRMAAEPFFFSRSREKNSRESYARIMRFFVAAVCLMFLFVTLFINQWKYFIGPKYWVGLSVVPILLLANICLGIYYNLAIWYKLSNKTYAGLVITLFGVLITIVINYFLIPRFGYIASAWATLACYASMMLLSYWWGQRVYPIPYRRKKLLVMLITMLFIYFSYLAILEGLADSGYVKYLSMPLAIGLFLGYIQVIISLERNELRRIPLLAKWIKKN